MNIEELLKSISELLKKNEQFLIDHPEIFQVIEDRLHKAIDYEDYQPEEDDEEDFYNDPYDESAISDMFDKLPEDDIDEDMDGDIDEDEANTWLKENDPELQSEEVQDTDEDGDLDIPPQVEEKIKENDVKTDKPKVSRSGYREWEPKASYAKEHQETIDKFMSEGWSHREAERMANVHDSPGSFMEALKWKIKPTQPSERMIKEMRGIAGDWLRNAERKISESAEAKKNPIKHASAKALTAHEDVHGDFKRAYDEFLASDDVKGLRGRERAKAIKAFKDKWHTENPDLRENAIAAAESGKTLESAMKERKEHLKEGELAITEAGKIGPGMGSAGEFSTAASGAEGTTMTGQAGAQMAGGTQEEGGYTSGIVKDPSMHFAETNPEYVESLKQKLNSKLNPDQQQRLNAIRGFKKKGTE